MEFVAFEEAWAALRAVGAEESERTREILRLALRESPDLTVIDVAAAEHPAAARLPAEIIRMPREKIAGAIEAICHKLHLQQVLVIPVGRWKELFEAVSLTMAKHDKWRAVDSTATVEANTHDGLLIGPADHHTLKDLALAVLADGSKPIHGITIAAAGTPILIEVMPPGEVVFSIGSGTLADLVCDVLGVPAA